MNEDINQGDIVTLANGSDPYTYRVARIGPTWLTLAIPGGGESLRLPRGEYRIVMPADGMLV
jgi:hypothetical protein